MNREIEFRGQKVDTKEWVYGGSVIKFNDNGVVIYFMPSNTERCIAYHENETDDITSIEGNFYKVKNICQYTGLKDKNGQKIYEGDILRDSLGWVFTAEWDSENARFIGRHEKPRGETYICYVGREPKAEIIGNIYENPELLQDVER